MTANSAPEAPQQSPYRDALTGLLNRPIFDDRLAHAIERSARQQVFALMYMDIDHFKAINDAHGKEAGDALLKAFADRLKKTMRTSDSVARFNADEFAVIAENVGNADGAKIAASKIIQAMRPKFMLNGTPVGVTASIGIVLGKSADIGQAVIMEKAVQALSEAKKAGGDRFTTAPD